MIMSVKDTISRYDITVDQMTQLCGQNMTLKSFLINSICKHFSADKYMEYEEKMIDNILIDGEIPGRKAWECIRISSIEDVVSFMQINKKSVMQKILKEYLIDFDNQTELMEIDNLLISIFNRLNRELLEGGRIELQYELADILSIVCNTTLKTAEGKDIHELCNYDLFCELLGVVKKLQNKIPDKRMIIFENIDCFLTIDEYVKFARLCEELAYDNNCWFIFSISHEGYLYCSGKYLESINIINDVVFSIGIIEQIITFLNSSYPVNRVFGEDDLLHVLPSVIHSIGKKKILYEVEEQVIMKLINDSIGIHEKWEKCPKEAELKYLEKQLVV